MDPIRTSDQLIETARTIARKSRPKVVAVAAAQDEAVLEAVAEAHADGLVESVLVGDRNEIERAAERRAVDITGMSVHHESDATASAHCAAELASKGDADIIMKGFLPTSAMLRAVLDQRYGLRHREHLSHCALLDIPGYDRLLNFTDGGMIVKPDLEQKLAIIANAALVGRALGLSPVRVAVSEVDSPELLSRTNREGAGVIAEGPLDFEAATFLPTAERRNPASRVAGRADVFVADSIEECNVVAKSLINFAGAIFAGVVVGARVPVSLVSRTDTVKNKIAALALACVLSDFYQKHNVWGD